MTWQDSKKEKPKLHRCKLNSSEGLRCPVAAYGLSATPWVKEMVEKGWDRDSKAK